MLEVTLTLVVMLILFLRIVVIAHVLIPSSEVKRKLMWIAPERRRVPHDVDERMIAQSEPMRRSDHPRNTRRPRGTCQLYLPRDAVWRFRN